MGNERINWEGKATEKDYLAAMIIATAIVFAFFIYINFIPKPLFQKKLLVEVIEINGECEECLNVRSAVESMLEENENVEIKSKNLDYDTKEAQLLIERYDIEKVPAIIVVSKDIDELNLDKESFSFEENSAVFDKSVPYIDINSGEVKGFVKLIEIQDSSCEDCMPLSQLKTQLEKWGIKIIDYEFVDSNSEKGKKLINDNNLDFLPSLLVSKDIEEYWWAFSQIESSFTEKDDYYVFKNPISPYKEISTGKVKGIVSLTYLTDKSCEDCFNVSELKVSFMKLGIFIDNEKYVDVSSSEGKQLIEKYDIDAVPTVILSKEISDYKSIKEVWEQLGTFEEDGFVLRKLDKLNVNYQKI
jgi:hypothetical protein